MTPNPQGKYCGRCEIKYPLSILASSFTKSIKVSAKHRAPDTEMRRATTTVRNLQLTKFSHVFKTHISGSGDSIIPSSNTIHLSFGVMYSAICCDRWMSAMLCPSASYFFLMHSFVKRFVNINTLHIYNKIDPKFISRYSSCIFFSLLNF